MDWENKSQHPTNEELLLVADGEASSRQTAGVRGHLIQCPACRSRLAELESTFSHFMAFHEAELQSRPSLPGHARSSLRVRLEEMRIYGGAEKIWSRSWQLAVASLALLVVGGSLWATRYRAANQTEEIASALPRRSLTPGAVRAVQIGELCASANAGNDPPLNPTLEQAVFHEYGLTASSKTGYAVDYLISPTLGGTASLENLWPQPYLSTTWDAQVKDVLEDHLRELVCQGKLPLATAQNEIAADWIAAYKRHFHTNAPLSNIAALGSIGMPAHARFELPLR